MSYVILHNDGAYNLYCSVSDGAVFSEAVTLDQLTGWYRREYGESGMKGLPERLGRAQHKGTSGGYTKSLKEEISVNRAGDRGKRLSLEDFISRFLTLPKKGQE